MVFDAMPISMAPSSPSNTPLGMQFIASEDDDYKESADDDDDCSFSLSGLAEEDSDADPALLTRAVDDSVSFSFSVRDSPFEAECSMFNFAESLPSASYVHAGGSFKPSSPCLTTKIQHDGDEEGASLVPLIHSSGLLHAESSVCHNSKNAGSRRSFTFLSNMEHETEHTEAIAMRAKSSGTERELEVDGGAGGKHHVDDDNDGNIHPHRGNHQGVLDDQDVFCKRDHNDRGYDDAKVCTYNGTGASGGGDNTDAHDKHAPDDQHTYNDHEHAKRALSDDSYVCAYCGNINCRHDDGLEQHVLHHHGKCTDHEHVKKAFSNDLSADSIMKFAGEGLLQPWSSSKLSKSCGHQAKTRIGNSRGGIHPSHVSPSKSVNYTSLLSHSPDIRNSFGMEALGSQPAHRTRECFDSEPFSPRGTLFMKGVGSPTHTPLHMPTTATRKTSSLFARRAQNAGHETLSLLFNAQRFSDAALSPPSRGSSYSTSYRTSSSGSTHSSGYSSSSGKSSSRRSSRNALIVDARCSLRQRMDEELHHDPSAQLHRKEDPNADLQRKGDPNAQLHRKGDPNSCLQRKGYPSIHPCEDRQAQSKAKADQLAAAAHGIMSPATPRSPLSWRSVLSLQPLNPSHVPQDEWELFGKPNSRSHSQRSTSSRGSSYREGRRSSAFTSAEFLGHSTSSKQTGSKKAETKANTKKIVKGRGGYWALNPMQWFKQCRNEKQVVDTSTKEQKRRRYTVYQACK